MHFAKLPFWLIQHEAVTKNDLLVYMVLAAHKNAKTGLCCPSMELLAKEARLAENTVRSALRHLKSLGIVGWTEGGRLPGVGARANSYWVAEHGPKGSTTAPFKGSTSELQGFNHCTPTDEVTERRTANAVPAAKKPTVCPDPYDLAAMEGVPSGWVESLKAANTQEWRDRYWNMYLQEAA